MSQTRCLICGKKYTPAPQAQSDVCRAEACQLAYRAGRARAYRAHSRSPQHGNNMMVVVYDPSGCFDKDARLIAVHQSVAMGMLPTGLVLKYNGKQFVVRGQEFEKQTLVQLD